MGNSTVYVCVCTQYFYIFLLTQNGLNIIICWKQATYERVYKVQIQALASVLGLAISHPS